MAFQYKLQNPHMIDLTNKKIEYLNKSELEELKLLVEKYGNVLQYVHGKYIYELASMLEIGISHINNNHSNLLIDWKVWPIILLKNMIENNIEVSSVPMIIDEFLEFYKNEYINYCNDIFSSDDFERDRGFVWKFMNRNNSSNEK